jgi:hypothetical protein
MDLRVWMASQNDLRESWVTQAINDEVFMLYKSMNRI